jgi:transcriptional regulator with XRE-family HTH domain
MLKERCMQENAIAVRLKKLRDDANKTQEEVAKRLGISRSHLSHIERGGDLPGRELLLKFSMYYMVSAHWLMTGHGRKNIMPKAAEDQLVEALNDPRIAEPVKTLIRERLRLHHEEREKEEEA